MRPLLRLIGILTILNRRPRSLNSGNLGNRVINLRRTRTILSPLTRLMGTRVTTLVDSLHNRSRSLINLIMVTRLLNGNVRRPLKGTTRAGTFRGSTIVLLGGNQSGLQPGTKNRLRRRRF